MSEPEGQQNENNIDRGEPLPPGWQKKLEIGHQLDNEVYQRGRAMDGNENDDEIIDILDDY